MDDGGVAIGHIQTADDLREFVRKELRDSDLSRLVRQAQGTEPWHLVGAAGEPAFAGGWVNFDTLRPARFYRRAERVYLEGMIKSGTLGSAAFVLPAGYGHGAGAQLNFSVASNGAYGELAILANGSVVPGVGSTVYFDLSGISFRVA